MSSSSTRLPVVFTEAAKKVVKKVPKKVARKAQSRSSKA